MLTELLAPAKDKETAFAAIDCGADAVYIGACAFGARKKASNSIEDLKEVVDYAHKFWVKVFVTINTILTDDELEDALLLIKKLEKIGIDALIIQDMGLLEKLIELKTTIPIHISTQCDNYLPQKVKFYNNIGVSRVVLARELSLKQIEKIHQENPNLELEAFIHGALCVSMSGQCYLSHFIGGRSANRGECAQPCRKKYTVMTSEGKILKEDFYALCLKDFNASNSIDKMINSGITSLKIEGRLKDISYVKNIVAYYRQKLGKGISSGRLFYSFTPNPEKSFNRGFTEYFLNGRCDCFNQESPKSKGEYLGEVIELKKGCFKIKTSKDINSQDGIYFRGEGFLVNKFENGFVYPNRNVSLKIGDKLWRNFDAEFEKEILKPTKRQVGIDIIIDENIQITDEDGISVTNQLPYGEKAQNPQKMKETLIKQFSKTGESDFYIKNIDIKKEIPFIPVSVINNLRREIFSELMKKRIDFYNKNIKQKQSEMTHTQYFTDEVDYRANVHNKFAEIFYKKCGCKVTEFSIESSKPRHKIELMHCKHCIKYALNICKAPQELILIDEKGERYPLEFDCKNCEMKVLSEN